MTTTATRPSPGYPGAWRSSELADDRAWRIDLTEAQREEIARGARAAHARGVAPTAVTAADVPLAGMQEAIASWSDALGHGLGFVLLRRFPIDLLSPEETEVAYVGLGTHLGRPVGQNADGDVLTHVRDERLPEGGPKVRRYRTREAQDFHTDAADVIGLLCLHQARSGGASRIVSSWAVHDEMLRRRPDLVEVLKQPMYWDRQNEERPGELPWFTLAPVIDVGGAPRVFYIGWYLRDAQRHADVPRLTPEQVEAMELLESIAHDPAFHLPMDFEPGDVQLLNNARILHARDAYEDDEDPAARRHLLRLWLAAHRFASVEADLRKGAGA